MRLDALWLSALLVTALACGGEASDDTVTREEASAPSPALESSEEENVHSERESYLRERIVELAEQAFPDDTGLEWPILGFDHQEHLTYVEVEPEPSTVGYPRFQLVVSFADEADPLVVATYAEIEGQYKLLSTSPDLEDELPPELP